MTSQALRIVVRDPACPLCHTANRTVTAESLRAGAIWVCARCGQTWSAERLERVVAYAQFAAAYESSTTGTTP